MVPWNFGNQRVSLPENLSNFISGRLTLNLYSFNMMCCNNEIKLIINNMRLEYWDVCWARINPNLTAPYNYLLSKSTGPNITLYSTMVKLFSRRYTEEVLIFLVYLVACNWSILEGCMVNLLKKIITGCKVKSDRRTIYRKQIPPTEMYTFEVQLPAACVRNSNVANDDLNMRVIS